MRDLPGVTVVDLESLSDFLAEVEAGREVEAARHIVLEEVGQFLAWQRSVRVAPTVVALRTKAADVVAAELARFESRAGVLDPATRAEVETLVRRVVDKLLHAPTVRVKELAGGPDGEQYAEVVRELFDLGHRHRGRRPGRRRRRAGRRPGRRCDRPAAAGHPRQRPRPDPERSRRRRAAGRAAARSSSCTSPPRAT